MYRILRPIYVKTGETTDIKGETIEWNRVEFEEVGTARNMAEALKKFPRGYWSKCYSPVLERITVH